MGHSELVWTATWSHDNRRIASCGADNLVQIWDAMTGDNAMVCKGHSQPVYDVEWASGDKLLASASGDKTVRIWDKVSGEKNISIMVIQHR